MIDICKNKREIVRVRKREHKGHIFVDVRFFFQADDGELRPTRQGITINLDRAGDLANAIRKVAAQEVIDAD